MGLRDRRKIEFMLGVMNLNEVMRDFVRQRKEPALVSVAQIASVDLRVVPSFVESQIEEQATTSVEGNRRTFTVEENVQCRRRKLVDFAQGLDDGQETFDHGSLCGEGTLPLRQLRG